ncbi:MAG: sugar ABC transporter ATP-binding protein, partial [Rhodococcus sp. (in: high G+C Gram-positive bacteria)]
VYVTHDQVEAMTMGDRVAVLLDGKLQQIASPRELYDNPVNTFVAGFIGSPGMNLVDAPVHDGAAVLGELRIPVPSSARERVVVGIRPESWDLVGDSSSAGLSRLHLTVELIEELGAESFVYASAPGIDGGWTTPSGRISVRVDRKLSIALAETVRLVPKLDELFFFDSATGLRLS